MKYIFPAICILLLNSCVSTRYIDVQILEPASVQLPHDINNLYIAEPEINSIADVVIEDTSHRKEEYFQKFIQAFDSTLATNLRESPALDNTTIYLENEKDIIGNGEQSDLVVSFKKIFLTDTVKPKPEELGYEFAWYSFYDIYYRVQVQVSNLKGDKFYDTRILSDTLSWRGSGNIMEESSRLIPPAPEAIAQTGEIAAREYAHKLFPFWVTEERVLFFNRNKYMRQGYKAFLNNHLNEAIENWKYLYEAGTPQLASIAAHNIAVIYEMQDDVKSCELWATNSLRTKWHYQTEKYLARIKERVAEKSKLDAQLK